MEKARRARAWEQIERVEAAKKQAGYERERLLVRALSSGDPGLMERARREIPASERSKLLANPRVMAEIYEGRAARETDPARKRALLLQANRARMQQVMDAAKSLPPEQRAKLLRDLKEGK